MTEPNAPLRFYGGMFGALAPFALFLAGVGWLGLSGAPDEKGFWPILVAALLLGLLLARDRKQWAETVIEGTSQPLVMIMILAWMLAGILGALMGASGFVEALVWVSHSLGVEGAGYVVASFLICCVVSTSTGTSLGTVILVAPLLYPAGGALGANPAILMGAILGGSTFGDNVSPVSDTTIASAMTQRADMAGVVRSRLRYALPAAAAAMLVFGLLGGGAETPPAEAPGVATSLSASGAPAAAATARGLPMLVVPIVVLALLLTGRHLLHGLLVGVAVAAGVGLATGLLAPADILRIDVESFGARGLIVDGIDKAVGVSVFTLLLMGLVAAVEAAGIHERVVILAERRTSSSASAERWTFATMSAAVFLTTHSTVAILTVGDITRRLGERFGVHAYRRANILDLTACSWPHLVPWFIPAILTASTTVSGEAYGMPRLSPLQVGVANAHSWALLGMVLLAVFFGYGRRRLEKRS